MLPTSRTAGAMTDRPPYTTSYTTSTDICAPHSSVCNCMQELTGTSCSNSTVKTFPNEVCTCAFVSRCEGALRIILNIIGRAGHVRASEEADILLGTVIFLFTHYP